MSLCILCLLCKNMYEGVRKIVCFAVIAFGGTTPNTNQTAEFYFASNASWVPAPRMLSPRNMFASTKLQDGKILVAGGDPLAPTAEIFDPATKSWSYTQTMLDKKKMMQLLVLPDGKGGPSFFSVTATVSVHLKMIISGLFAS